MKNKIILLYLGLTLCNIAFAQQNTNTLFFLENAPQRHSLNPAFEPVSQVYVGITPLSYMGLSGGNNALAMNDLIYKKDGKLVTALYPGEGDRLLKRLKNDLSGAVDMDMALLNFGFRIKDFGYFHLCVSTRMQTSMSLPKGIMELIYTDDPTISEGRQISLDRLGLNAQAYTEFAAGYSHNINESWSIGGKLKFILGHAYTEALTTNSRIEMYPDRIKADINGDMRLAAPIIQKAATALNDGNRIDINNIDLGNIDLSNIGSYFSLAGMGAAVDLGVTYKPHPQVRISLAVTDLGFVRWKTSNFTLRCDSAYTGPVVRYSDIAGIESQSLGTALGDTIVKSLTDFATKSFSARYIDDAATNKMLNTRINAGIDANFWENRIALGLFSSTLFRNGRVYEELTLGASLRPVNWFNLALSYSFLNGRWNSMGAGLSFMPYDGLNFMLTTDYIPFTYADIMNGSEKMTVMPYKMKGLNIGLGVTIVIGTNKKKNKQELTNTIHISELKKA